MRPKNTKCFSRRIPPATFGDFGSLQSHSPQGAKSPYTVSSSERRADEDIGPYEEQRTGCNPRKTGRSGTGPYGGKQPDRRADDIRPYKEAQICYSGPSGMPAPTKSHDQNGQKA